MCCGLKQKRSVAMTEAEELLVKKIGIRNWGWGLVKVINILLCIND